MSSPPSTRSVSSRDSLASGASLSRRPRIRSRARTVASPPGALLLPPRSATDAASSSGSSQDIDSVAGEVTLVTPLPSQPPMTARPTKAEKVAPNLAPIETSYKPPPSAFSRDPELTPNVRDSFSTQKSSSSSFYPPSTSTFSASTSLGSPNTVEQQAEEPAEEEEEEEGREGEGEGEQPPIPQNPDISLLPEGVDEMQGYDGDDVAYRLRLLVNNNYFLPPAHMKPSPQDFANSMNAKKQPKSSPTFLDIFRVGKSRSKPSSPITPAPGPVLRTTSDSITYTHRTQPHHPPPSPHLPSHPPINGALDRRRVVVVRERMPDIGLAAKQAEQELKSRSSRRDQGPDKGRQLGQPPSPLQQQDVGDVIDPTDSVDVPLPAPNYPFAVQASELHGLGVQDSVGAALLAERLPPNSPKSQNTSMYGRDDWRKQLLHAAVHHSLGNSPNESVLSQPPGTSSPMLAAPRVNGLSSRSSTPGMRANKLQQRITEPHSFETEDLSLQDGAQKESSFRQPHQNQGSTSKPSGKFLAPLDTSDSSYLPARAITPISNVTPLTPAPRKQSFKPLYSISDSDLKEQLDFADADLSTSTSPRSKLRRSMSTPMLSDAYDVVRQFGMTPPPPPVPLTRGSSQLSVLSQSFETHRELSPRNSTFSSHSHLDEVEERAMSGPPRLSALGTRPSLSSYSVTSLSPTTSAFQEMLNHTGDRSITPSIRRVSIEARSEETHARSIASPPPRPSTSIAHIALRPPPRSSSLNHNSSIPGKSAFTSEPRIEVSDASPPRGDLSPTSRYASTSRYATLNPIPLSLKIPSTTETVAIHSPAPSSPTSFFDTIQTHPNAMDDLDSSDDDEEDDGDGAGGEERENDDSQPRPPLSPPISPFVIDARARANSTVSTSPMKPPNSIMRLGNFSAPYVGRGQYTRHQHQQHPYHYSQQHQLHTAQDRMRVLPVGVVDHKKALGFTPARTPFFSERKSDLGHGSDISTSLLVQAQAQHAQEKNMSDTSCGDDGDETRTTDNQSLSGFTSPTSPLSASDRRRPATADQVISSSPAHVAGASKPEAIRKLDGMLVQHMEAEKDTIRKIAGALKSSSQVNLVAGGLSK